MAVNRTTVGELDQAIHAMDMARAMATLAEITGLSVRACAFDESEPVLYASFISNGRVQALCAYVDAEGELVTLGEAQAPPFNHCPPELIGELDPTFDSKALFWRRDCLVHHYRQMGIQANLGLPLWTALYSEAPILQLGHAAHHAVLAGSHGFGQELAVTDGINWKTVHLSDLAADVELIPLPGLEWSQSGFEVLASKGRASLSYVGMGPAEFRVGMLFNDRGGLLTWSASVVQCHHLAGLAGTTEDGFPPASILKQLNAWQGNNSTV